MNNLKTSAGVHVHSDKTGNLYQMDKQTYHDFIQRSLTDSYKKTSESALDNINNAGFLIASNLEVCDRTEPYSPRTPFFSLKDHKPDFLSKPAIRLTPVHFLFYAPLPLWFQFLVDFS